MTQIGLPTPPGIPIPTPSGIPTTTPNDTKILFDRLVTENQQIEDYITMLKHQQATDNQKAHYQNNRNNLFTVIYNWLFYLYLLGLVILVYVLFFTGVEMSRNGKVGIVVVFLLYPFLVYPVERFLWQIMKVVYSFVVHVPLGEDPIQNYQRSRGDIFVLNQ
jgi:hypothetical protein